MPRYFQLVRKRQSQDPNPMMTITMREGSTGKRMKAQTTRVTTTLTVSLFELESSNALNALHSGRSADIACAPDQEEGLWHQKSR
jgi:hypothetical protein